MLGLHHSAGARASTAGLPRLAAAARASCGGGEIVTIATAAAAGSSLLLLLLLQLSAACLIGSHCLLRLAHYCLVLQQAPEDTTSLTSACTDASIRCFTASLMASCGCANASR